MKFKHDTYRAKWWLAEKFNYTPQSPLNLDIELAKECNLKCVMCPYGDPDWDNATDKGLMKAEIANLAILEGWVMKIPAIKFNFRGEGGLHRGLKNFVKLASKLGYIDIQMNTNLVCFSERRLKEICEAGMTKLIVSIDGATKETYEKIRVGSKWEKLISNLQYAHSLPERPFIKVQMTQQGDNNHEVELFKNQFSQWADQVIVKPVRTGKGERKPCPQPRQRIVVAYDGTVFGCCGNWNDEYPIGKFPTESLSDIWSGDKMKSLRAIASDPSCGFPCDKCDVRSSYK